MPSQSGTQASPESSNTTRQLAPAAGRFDAASQRPAMTSYGSASENPGTTTNSDALERRERGGSLRD